MYETLFEDFLLHSDVLRVYDDGKLIYKSSEKMLLPLLRYIKEHVMRNHGVVVFDKIAGNAAALLLVIARCKEVYSPIASKPAVTTLDQYHIKHHFLEVVPFIQKAGTEEICPMEKMSLNSPSPENFYQKLKDLV